MSIHEIVPGPVQADRSVGAVLASAAGDSLGAGYEFGPPLPPETPVRMKGGGTFGWEPGEWTDDTQLALAILTVLAGGNADLSRIEGGFRAWYRSRPADVGAQTRAVLKASGPLEEAAATFTAAHPNGAAGNGSLMRTGPVALAHPRDPVAIAELACAVSALTHPDPDCLDACVLWSVAIDHTIHHAPPGDEPWDWVDSFRPGLEQLPAGHRERWAALVDEAAAASPLAFPNNGWVVHAFQAAIAAICSTPIPAGRPPATQLVLALEHAVRSGGDTDTVAAIAGSLLGARWGATAVPLGWRRLLHGRRTYDAASLSLAELERLARLATRRGQADAHGWPTVRSMLPHYAEAWPDRPRTVELEGVLFGNVAALGAAIDEGCDTVISLCRMGTDEVPPGVEHHVLGLLDTTEGENPNLMLLLQDIVDGLDAMTKQGRRVFVHCVQAQNRTPTIAAAWLLHRGQAVETAVDIAGRALNRPKHFLIEALHQLANLEPNSNSKEGPR